MRNKMMSFANKIFYDKHIENITIKTNGEAFFKDTDLSVFYVGSLLTIESKTSILEDYPYLTLDDLKFAKLFYHTENNKRPEELIPAFDPIESTIDKFRKITEKKGI